MKDAEIGWLIEDRSCGFVLYWAGGREWTSDPNVAIRFARKLDGERVARNERGRKLEVCDHMWCPDVKSEVVL